VDFWAKAMLLIQNSSAKQTNLLDKFIQCTSMQEKRGKQFSPR
jgi:hypothetical protein